MKPHPEIAGVVGKRLLGFARNDGAPCLFVQTGAIHRPILGINALNLSAATSISAPNATGLLVGAETGQSAILAKGPADKAGIQSGDIITELDGQTVNADIFSLVSKYQPGDALKITILRQGTTKELTAKLGASGL